VWASGWFLACIVLPPIAVLAPLLLFALSMFWLMSRPADETLLRAEDQTSLERLLTALHQGMSRTELYSIGFYPMADARCTGTLPTPSRQEPHPAVESDFLRIDRSVAIVFDERDRIAKISASRFRSCPRS